MGTYAISGDAEVDVTIGSSTFRAYSVGIAAGGNALSARAFEDDPDDTPVVTVGKFRDLTLNFRKDPGAAVGDTVTVSIAFAEGSGATDISVSADVTATNFNVNAEGIADYSLTLRVNPAVAS